MEKMKELNSLKHSLIDMAKAEVAKGADAINAQELGEVTDMIKDLAEAEKFCMEACYYEAMMDDGEEVERRGYDRWRYSSGRFAPKGRGIRGYTPMMDEPRTYPTAADRTDGRTRMGYHGDPKEKLEASMDTMGEIWADADTDLKAKMKAQVKDLLYQMEQAE